MSSYLRPQSLLRLLAVSGFLLAGSAQADMYGDVSALTKAGNTAEAIAKADQYLSSNSRDPQMRFLKGVAQSKAGDLQAAAATFEALIQEYPELPEPTTTWPSSTPTMVSSTRRVTHWKWLCATTQTTL